MVGTYVGSCTDSLLCGGGGVGCGAAAGGCSGGISAGKYPLRNT